MVMTNECSGMTSLVAGLDNINVTEIMTTDILTVYEGWSVKRLAGFFIKHDISGAPVIASDDELVGVVTQSDVVRFESKTPTEFDLQCWVRFYCGPYGGILADQDLVHIKEKANQHCTVNAIMTPKVSSVDVSLSVAQTCAELVEKNVHRLFITDNGRLVGVVSAMDILRYLVKT